jgi:hypothetical protein
MRKFETGDSPVNRYNRQSGRKPMAKTRWLLAGIALESAVIFGFYASDKFQEDGT